MSIFGLARNHQGRANSNLDKSSEQPAFAPLLSALRSANSNEVTPLVGKQSKVMSSVAADTDSLLFLNRLWETRPVTSHDPSSPAKFVDSIAAAAKGAAQQLGTSAAAVIAIAALETGWGKHIITSNSGDSSHNLFGIKANDNNPATTAIAQTVEFINGVRETLTQPFRTYQSADESVADFAHFIRSNPRYSRALSQAQDAHAFIDQIHLAGYATDPDYASKVKSVMSQVEHIMRGNRP